jgi:hypothetical protein
VAAAYTGSDLAACCVLSCSNKVDLNRNFPDPIELQYNRSALLQPLPNAQPETQVIMEWMTNTQ